MFRSLANNTGSLFSSRKAASHFHKCHHLRASVYILAIASSLLGKSTAVPAQQHQQHFSTTTTGNKMSKRANDELSDGLNGSNLELWNGSNKEGFDSLEHPGYSFEPDPENNLGGWHAHRAVWQPSEEGADRPPCWIKDEVMDMITKFDYDTMPIGRAPKILVLYGSLRPTSFSRKSAYEFARLLDLLGCDVRVYNPRGLPVRDPDLENEPKVQELRALTHWSDGHMWVSPEMHGTITGVFKNQIDWIPLNTGSVRPTQGKTCCVSQINGGSQSFNAVNVLRQLARWMRMPCSTNQSSIAKAWKEFGDDGRMKDSDFRGRVVDVAEEFAKFTAVMVPVKDDLVNRYSERMEQLEKGRLLTQAEKEKSKDLNMTVEESRKG
jgi:arsenic resistance protein ArsH